MLRTNVRTAAVTVFGSAHEDIVLTAESFPSIGETVVAKRAERGFGGKGANQAVAAAEAGADVRFVGVLGEDAVGRRILDNFEQRGVDTALIHHSSSEATGIAVVIVDDAGRNQIVVPPVAEQDWSTEAVASAMVNVTAGDIVVVQCEIPRGAIEAVLRQSAAVGAFSVLNLAPFTTIGLDVLSLAGLIVLNEGEALELTGFDVATDVEQLVADAVRITRTACIITLGEAGSLYAVPSGRSIRVPAGIVAGAVDTTGAGDVYVGTLAANLAAGLEVEPAMEAATRAAGRSVLQLGAQGTLAVT